MNPSNTPDTRPAQAASVRRNAWTLGFVTAVVVLGGGFALWRCPQPAAKPKGVYTPEGFGGYVTTAPNPAKPTLSRSTTEAGLKQGLEQAAAQYNAGQFTLAEATARTVRSKVPASASPALRKAGVQAHLVQAYAAARRKDLKGARAEFAAVHKEAASLTGVIGKQDETKTAGSQPNGRPEIAIEEQAAYQHAVCTAALGDKVEAEAEYCRFMQQYPDSPLVAAAVKRIGRLHGGDIPKEAEAVWKQAMATAKAHEMVRQRALSMCGPECLAELLRRQGKKADVQALAREMKTSDQGTRLDALAKAAKQRGFAAQGLALTTRGLAKQKLPVVALISPGHYVLVESLATDAVRYWDPAANGAGKGAARTVSGVEWNRMWGGVTLALR